MNEKVKAGVSDPHIYFRTTECRMGPLCYCSFVQSGQFRTLTNSLCNPLLASFKKQTNNVSSQTKQSYLRNKLI